MSATVSLFAKSSFFKGTKAHSQNDRIDRSEMAHLALESGRSDAKSEQSDTASVTSLSTSSKKRLSWAAPRKKSLGPKRSSASAAGNGRRPSSRSSKHVRSSSASSLIGAAPRKKTSARGSVNRGKSVVVKKRSTSVSKSPSQNSLRSSSSASLKSRKVPSAGRKSVSSQSSSSLKGKDDRPPSSGGATKGKKSKGLTSSSSSSSLHLLPRSSSMNSIKNGKGTKSKKVPGALASVPSDRANSVSSSGGSSGLGPGSSSSSQKRSVSVAVRRSQKAERKDFVSKSTSKLPISDPLKGLIAPSPERRARSESQGKKRLSASRDSSGLRSSSAARLKGSKSKGQHSENGISSDDDFANAEKLRKVPSKTSIGLRKKKLGGRSKSASDLQVPPPRKKKLVANAQDRRSSVGPKARLKKSVKSKALSSANLTNLTDEDEKASMSSGSDNEKEQKAQKSPIDTTVVDTEPDTTRTADGKSVDLDCFDPAETPRTQRKRREQSNSRLPPISLHLVPLKARKQPRSVLPEKPRSKWALKELRVLTEEAAEWVATVLKKSYDLKADDVPAMFVHHLQDGLDLCELLLSICPKHEACVAALAEHGFHKEALPGTIEARKNLSMFHAATTKLCGGDELFEVDDIVVNRNHKRIVVGLLQFAKCSISFGIMPPTIVEYELEIGKVRKAVESKTPLPDIDPGNKSSDKLARHLFEVISRNNIQVTCLPVPNVPMTYTITPIGGSPADAADVPVRIIRGAAMARMLDSGGDGRWKIFVRFCRRQISLFGTS